MFLLCFNVILIVVVNFVLVLVWDILMLEFLWGGFIMMVLFIFDNNLLSFWVFLIEWNFGVGNFSLV